MGTHGGEVGASEDGHAVEQGGCKPIGHAVRAGLQGREGVKAFVDKRQWRPQTQQARVPLACEVIFTLPPLCSRLRRRLVAGAGAAVESMYPAHCCDAWDMTSFSWPLRGWPLISSTLLPAKNQGIQCDDSHERVQSGLSLLALLPVCCTRRLC